MNRDVVTITDAAKEYINQRCDGINTIVGVKINGKGCSGHSYEYTLVNPVQVGAMDETIMWPGGGLTISAFSLMYMIGSRLDVRKSIMEEILVWDNPSAVDHCGCGESFSLKA
jgi:iron-sulfur cluster assembly protein